ncbi:MAG: hypothetical protein IJ303_01110 [Clostridia bacterium]|nr:hypothetical protein [Clostridia bacterium]
MYYRGVQNGHQNSTQDEAFQYLNRKFAGRGLAAQAKMSANRYGEEGMYGSRGASSSPLTLGEFEQNYRSHSVYYGAAANIKAYRTEEQRAKSRLDINRPTMHTAHPNVRASSPMQNARTKNGAVPAKRPVPAANSAAIVRPARKQQIVRRAVTNEKVSQGNPFSVLAANFRNLPVGALLTVVICAVSLMFIVGSSVLLSDASNDYVDIQNEISALAKKEDELLIALEVKNDLRTIENIAVNELGMVKKDLVTRQYIKLGDEDMIEAFDEEDTNVGLSTLLSAIRGEG